MTHEPDIPERDPAVDAAWREHSTELPSAALDAAILAAAHRAVGSAPKATTRAAADADVETRAATRPQRWWMPLAAAATIGAVALGILQTMPQQDSITTPAASDAPAPARARVAPSTPSTQSGPSAPRDELPAAGRNQSPAAANEPAAPPAPISARAKPAAKVAASPATSATDNLAPVQAQTAIAPEAQRAAAPAPQPFPAEKKAESMESDVKDRARMAPKLATVPLAAADVPPAPPSAAAPTAAAPMSESARADVRQRSEAQPSSPMASGAVALGKNVARKDAAPSVDVDAWIARIRKLHDEGKLADAAKELVAMRAAVPDADARLPRELRTWATTVKP